MKIWCSNCGRSKEFRYTPGNAIKLATEEHWDSFGSALYCPECAATWFQRNRANRPLAGAHNTIEVINSLWKRRMHYAD